MAISKAPSGEIRALVIHGYPVPLSFCEAVDIKAFGMSDSMPPWAVGVSRSKGPCPAHGPCP